MNPVQSQPAAMFAALPLANAGNGASPSAAGMPQSIRGFSPGMISDAISSPAAITACATGPSQDSSQQGGFLGLVQNLIGQLGSYIQSLGGTSSAGTSAAPASSAAVPGEVYLA